MSRKRTTAMGKLLDFLAKLKAKKLHFHLAQYRDESIMVEIAVPGERWEVEFFADCSVEVESFRSDGAIGGKERIAELFARFSD